MPIPKYLLDLERDLPNMFKRVEDYSFMAPPATVNLPSLEKKELEEILKEPIERRYIHAEILENPTEVKKRKYEISGERSLELLRGKIYIGIDGSSKRIEREQLFFLFSRAVRYYYPIGCSPNGIRKKFDELVSRAFLVIDANIVKEENVVRRNEFETIKDLGVIIFGLGDREELEDIVDINNRAMGYEVRLRHLTELAIISNFIEEKVDELGMSPEDIVIVMDGPLMPRSVKAEEYENVIKDVVKRGCLILSFVKRISYSKILRSILLKDDEDDDNVAKTFSKVLFGTEDSNFVRRYYTDGILINKALDINTRTFMFKYKLIGKMGTLDADKVSEDYHPVAFYLKTRRNTIYRVEFPYYYYKKLEDPDYIASLAFALIYENSGCVPRPIELADSIAKIKKEEEYILSTWLDSAFKNKLGIELYKPYGGE